MKKIWTGFVLVWSLITRIRIPEKFIPAGSPLPPADAIIFMPLAGGLFGLIAALPARMISPVIPPQGAAWLAVALYSALGWSLHLDGWGDVWDGVGSGKRGDALRTVMKDARVGAFGVAGIATAIGARAALLGCIVPGRWLAACVISCGVGRCGGIAVIYLGEYPWPEGMARDIVSDFGVLHLACAAAATGLMYPVWPAGWAAGMVLSCAGGIAFAVWAKKNLGGVNGDVIGASSVLGEILTMAACAALGQ
jgi:adenosylcobinamide-GDP ribazoletransferase